MEGPEFNSALNDFSEARRQAAVQEILARLTGRSNELLSYGEVAEKLHLNISSERGVQTIPLKSIVGSVGRYSDFTRDFLPRSGENQQRWARVKAAMDSDKTPPIEVYKVGEAYFVLDGNHRVSVARQEGREFIDARVVEVHTDVPVTPDLQPDDLILKAEYADFMRKTDLPRLRPGADLSMKIPGLYDKLLEHISVHRYFMGIDFNREIAYDEAVTHWYDEVYMPIVVPIRERGLLRWFPDLTETDLYVWVSEHRAALESELGWAIRPDAALEDLAVHKNRRVETETAATGSWRLSKMYDRYTDKLFRDVLVPITGSEESWNALEQALLLAQREQSSLHGLHILPANARIDRPEALKIQERFNRRCAEAGVDGHLAIERGAVAARVSERALLTDLIVINVAHPPSPGLSGLGSGLRAIIRNSSRPILTVAQQVSPMARAVIAFDGSPRSREALFVATYLAERWHTALTVMTVTGRVPPSVQDFARQYLELHEVRAEFVVTNGPLDQFLEVIRDRKIDLVIMGGYSVTAVREVVFGSAVNYLLRQADCPLLICR